MPNRDRGRAESTGNGLSRGGFLLAADERRALLGTGGTSFSDKLLV